MVLKENILLWEGVLVLKELNLETVNRSELNLLAAYWEDVCYLDVGESLVCSMEPTSNRVAVVSTRNRFKLLLYWLTFTGTETLTKSHQLDNTPTKYSFPPKPKWQITRQDFCLGILLILNWIKIILISYINHTTWYARGCPVPQPPCCTSLTMMLSAYTVSILILYGRRNQWPECKKANLGGGTFPPFYSQLTLSNTSKSNILQHLKRFHLFLSLSCYDVGRGSNRQVMQWSLPCLIWEGNDLHIGHCLASRNISCRLGKMQFSYQCVCK